MATAKKKAVRRAKKGARIRQVAAIPFRLREDGDIEVLVVTSRTTRRFIVPKGWPMKGKSGRKAAAIEAQEEAGVLGKALKQPAGTYSYWKRMANGFIRVDVAVYLLEVTEEMTDWREAANRQRAWLPPADAALLIDEPELSTLLRDLTIPATVPA
ncbi:MULTISPECIES: NUDIX hydrolase [unclassified Mesorhizobium]|uniref:NUDIX hydrolase n=1 Tax=unclassified Mesorhizobium TaxID=325217 RepID=UPI00241606F4|nr:MULTISPECIES: NUDIX hydrolase [unclassified Mesorhizobium]WFP64946.1 NUDIX hydrolase [Mesorhizobium sp. WSM4904]WFP78218.1 NUDIX hydrolase [Mesorhizobium sp. WSM4906]